MAVGQGSNMGHGTYLGVGREVTYGTYVTATAGLNILSSSLKVTKETKILEELQTSRTNSNFIQLGRSVGGDIEFVFSPKQPACNYLLQNAFGGGAITSATATGDTVGSAAWTHQIDVRNFDLTYSSLSINHRKGETATGKIFEYKGIRVDQFSLKAEIDEALIATASLIAQDASLTTNDVSAQAGMATANQTPLSFVNGRLSLELATASQTTTSFWHVQSIDFKVSNNLVSDKASRRIGSDVIGVLPAGMAQFELSCTMRFDTSTAYDAMLAGTRFYGELEFLGDTLTGSLVREGVKLNFANLRITDAGDPEITSAGDALTSQVSFAVLRDPTASGYAVRATVTNGTSSYA
jgi:hypothetical protein